MDDGGLQIAHFGRIVSALAEIRVLIYGAWDKTRDFGNLFCLCAEDERKTGGESSRRLHGWKVEFSDVVAEHHKLEDW